MSAKKNKNSKERFKEIRNKKAFRDYFVDESLEAGIVLKGTEVKAIRSGQAQISDAFVRIEKGRPTLYHAHISEYDFGNINNHNPYRPRPLLMHKKEIRKLEISLQAGGKTLIPLKMYFKGALVKVQVGLCRGKKQYDKREDLKKKTDERETERYVKHYQ